MWIAADGDVVTVGNVGCELAFLRTFTETDCGTKENAGLTGGVGLVLADVESLSESSLPSS